jgi:hypothetical protein
MDSLSTASSSEYNSSATISSALILLAFVTSSDGRSVDLELTDITGRHYQLTPVLNTQNATATEEIIAQGKANGYTERKVRALLAREGYASAESVPVPPQSDAFGELWRVSAEPESAPEPTSEPVGGEGDGTLRRFREWCEERAESDKTHSYTRRKANRRYARGKDVDRSFVRDCEEFTTVLITYCGGTPASDETLAEQAKGFYPRQVTRKRRRILKREGVYDGYAGVSVLAPKSPDRVPQASVPTTHSHDFLWLSEHVEAEAFAPLRELEGFDVHVSVEHHHSAEVRTPNSVKARGSGMDSRRGDTTSLPQELAANLPLLNCRFDARGTPEYVEKWCANLRAGTDGSFSSQGVRRFRTLGSFEERADTGKARRKVQQAHSKAQALAQSLEYRTLSHQNHESPDSQEPDSPGTSRSSAESDASESCEGRGSSGENPPAGSRFTLTESRFTFREYG